MWSHILKHQLEVTQEEFWVCVRKGEAPGRGFVAMQAPQQSIPLFLLKELMRLGLSEKEALGLSAAEAAQKRAELLGENQ